MLMAFSTKQYTVYLMCWYFFGVEAIYSSTGPSLLEEPNPSVISHADSEVIELNGGFSSKVEHQLIIQGTPQDLKSGGAQFTGK